MTTMHIPEGYPEIYWLGMGSYDELSQAVKDEYGVEVHEGQTTEELVQEIKDEGFEIPDIAQPGSMCDMTQEQRQEQLKYLFSILKNNTCESCVENIQKQIAELLACVETGTEDAF